MPGEWPKRLVAGQAAARQHAARFGIKYAAVAPNLPRVLPRGRSLRQTTLPGMGATSDVRAGTGGAGRAAASCSRGGASMHPWLLSVAKANGASAPTVAPVGIAGGHACLGAEL